MTKGGDDNKELPPLPPKGNGSGGKSTPVDGALRDSQIEQLSSGLKQLKLQRKIEKLEKKLKEFKSCEVASSSSSNEETDASSEEEAKDKKGKKGDKGSYNTASFNYDNLPHSNDFPSVPVGNPPHTFRWDRLYQMEILDDDASNIARSECLENCACRC
jgi:hypothetical protein